MRIPSAIALVALASVASAQGTPPRRAHHELAYDEATKRIILTAGSTPVDSGQRFVFFNDLWSFDGARWTALPPSGRELSGIRIAYDTRRNRPMSFGGYARQSLPDLRVLENNTWTVVGQHPSLAAAEPGFVYDVKRDRFVTFGGSAGRGQAHGDTWEFDGAAWTKLTVAGPPARQGHVMVYDERRGRTVVFGGSGTSPGSGQPPPLLGDVWEFDGVQWAPVSATGPSPRASAGAAYDAKRGRIIIFGGATGDGFSGDTWAWDGVAWTKLATTGPEARAMGYIAYDKQRDRIVLFGGRKGWPDGDLNDTWEFDGSTWRRIQ